MSQARGSDPHETSWEVRQDNLSARLPRLHRSLEVQGRAPVCDLENLLHIWAQ